MPHQRTSALWDSSLSSSPNGQHCSASCPNTHRLSSSAFRLSGTFCRAADLTAATICSCRTPSAPSRATNSAEFGGRREFEHALLRAALPRTAQPARQRSGLGLWLQLCPRAGRDGRPRGAPRHSCRTSSVQPLSSSRARASCFSSSRAPLSTSCSCGKQGGQRGASQSRQRRRKRRLAAATVPSGLLGLGGAQTALGGCANSMGVHEGPGQAPERAWEASGSPSARVAG